MNISLKSLLQDCGPELNQYFDSPYFVNVEVGVQIALGLNHDIETELLQMIKVEGGTFNMGDENLAIPQSKAVRTFSIGKYQVTQYLWYAVMGNNPSHFKGNGAAFRPVESVSWHDVQIFIKKLNQKTGKKYRLPTEKEWEFAAKGGNKSQGFEYAGSNDIDSVAWYRDNSDDKTHTVGQKLPNELGIYDMSGNVLEWCKDWYENKRTFKIVRGGSFRNDKQNTTSLRSTYFVDDNDKFFGFRLVLG